MDRHPQIRGRGAHLDRKDAFRDQLPCTGTDDADAEDALGLGIDDELRHAVGAVQRDRAARGRPGKARDRDFTILFRRLCLGEPAPRQLGVGEDDSGNRHRLEGDFLAVNGIDRDAGLV